MSAGRSWWLWNELSVPYPPVGTVLQRPDGKCLRVVQVKIVQTWVGTPRVKLCTEQCEDPEREESRQRKEGDSDGQRGGV